ncbi:MAG: hypothetical protein FGM50_07510 [Mycobacterium sp.]|nr:hypothetical protein [Mycobacterium sp.]
MNTDPQQIRARVEAELADLPRFGLESDGLESEASPGDTGPADIEAIDAVGRRLEHAHQILVDALESVEKG